MNKAGFLSKSLKKQAQVISYTQVKWKIETNKSNSKGNVLV